MNIYNRSIAAAARVVHGRSAVEPQLKSALFERNHKLDSLFTVKTLAMKKKPKKADDSAKSSSEIQAEARLRENTESLDESGYITILRTGVVCNDCDSLVKDTLSVRGFNPHESSVLVGLDDGQGMVKIYVTVQSNKVDSAADNDILEDKKRSHYSEV